MTAEIKNVAVHAKANVYFDGKCVSHTLVQADGARLTVGVILPSTLTFNTGAPERMEIVDGRCRVTLAGAGPREYAAGSSFDVPGQSSFVIEALEPVHYVCRFG